MNRIRKGPNRRSSSIDFSPMLISFFILLSLQIHTSQAQNPAVVRLVTSVPASVLQDIVQEEGKSSDLIPNLLPVHLNWNWYTIAPITLATTPKLTQPGSTTTQKPMSQTPVLSSRSSGTPSSLRSTVTSTGYTETASTSAPSPKRNLTMTPVAEILNLLKPTPGSVAVLDVSSTDSPAIFSSSTGTTLSRLTTPGADQTSTTRFPTSQKGTAFATPIVIKQNSRNFGITTPPALATKSSDAFPPPPPFSSFLPISGTKIATTNLFNFRSQLTPLSILRSSTAPSADLRRSVNLTASAILASQILIKISVPPTFNNLSEYQPYLEDRISAFYHLAESRYDLLLAIFNYNSSLNFTLNGTDATSAALAFLNVSSDAGRNSSAQVVQLTWSYANASTQTNATVVFIVSTNGTALPASEVMQRFSLLSEDEISGYLATNLLQGPNELLASDSGVSTLAVINGTLGNTSVEIHPEVAVATNSWSLLGAVVGISTVAVVLLSLALVWLILFIYIKCRKKATKTGQDPIVQRENSQIIRIPLPASQQPLSVDHGMQTVILPRRSVQQPSLTSKVNEAEERNGHVSRNRKDGQDVGVGQVYQETMYHAQYSYATGNALADRAPKRPASSPDEGSVSVISSPPPPSKPPRMINEVQHLPGIQREENDSSLGQKRSNEVASSTNSRVKLLSVVKTNRIDPSNTNGKNSLVELQDRPIQAFRQRLEKTSTQPETSTSGYNGRRSANQLQDQRFSVAGKGDPFNRTDFTPNGQVQPRRPYNNAVPYEQTVQEIRQEVHLWRRSQNSYSPSRYD